MKKLEESQGRLRYLSAEEEQRLLAVATEPLRTIILVGIYTGLRIAAEALTLRWENIDLRKGLLTVESAYAKGKETSTLPLNRKLVDALTEQRARSKGEFVFVSRKGTPYRSVRTPFDNACRRAKLEDVSLHTLRHTFASKLAEQRVGDRTLQTLGRWKEPKMIQRYAHLSEEHLREAVEKIASNSPTIFTTPSSRAPLSD